MVQKSESVQSIDSMIEELSVNTKSTKVTADEALVDERRLDVSSILAVDPKYLKAENELRKIFGTKVVGSFGNHQNVSGLRSKHGGRYPLPVMRKMVLA